MDDPALPSLYITLHKNFKGSLTCLSKQLLDPPWREIAANRKMHMGFRLVPKSVTLNGRIVCIISPNSVDLGPYYVKVVEDTRIHLHSASEM